MAKVMLYLRKETYELCTVEVDLPLDGLNLDQIDDKLDECVNNLNPLELDWELDEDLVEIADYDIYDDNAPA